MDEWNLGLIPGRVRHFTLRHYSCKFRLTDQQQRHCQVLPAARLHCPQHSAHHGTAYADDRDDDDEPADGDRLRHHHAAAWLRLLFRRVVLTARVPPGSVDRMAVLLTDSGYVLRTVTALLWWHVGLRQWYLNMEQWWDDTDRGKLKYWEKNIIQRGW